MLFFVLSISVSFLTVEGGRQDAVLLLTNTAKREWIFLLSDFFGGRMS